MKYLADNFDIHAGGNDIVFPHCENVRAIGKAVTGKRLANYWINSELVMIDGKKMSRSLNNVYTIEDVEQKGFRGKEIRFFLLSTHYRKPLNFSFNALETSRNTVRKLNGFIQRVMRYIPGSGYADTDQLIYNVNHDFSSAMDDDLNISGALAFLFRFVGKISTALSQGQLNEKERDNVLEVMKKIDTVLGVMNFTEESLSEEVMQLIEERKVFRGAGNWKASDEIRDKLLEMGIEVSDTTQGMTWRIK
jgi:cysteinyl-tRNA synthetase